MSAIPAVDTASAASAEAAVKALIAAVPGSDWKIGYATIGYDQAADRTTVRELSANNTTLGVSLTIPTIVITGYTPTPDGGFSATKLTADVGTFKSDKATLTMTSLDATNFGTAGMAPIPFDKDKPVTSFVAMYANLLKIHVEHAGLGSVSFKDEADDTSFTYTGFSVDRWADGKIASMRIGPMDARFTDMKSGDPVTMQIGSAETTDTDLDALMRVYDPSRYVNGVGDQVWRNVVGKATYNDFTIDSGAFYMSMGGWTMENLKMRQPKEPFTAALDKMATLPKNAKMDDLPPDMMRAVVGIYSAFSLGKLGLTDISVDTDAGFGTLEAFTMKDLSIEGIGEISLDYLDAFYTDGFMTLGHFAAGGITFPGSDKLLAFLEATAQDKDVDFGDLAVRLGYIELGDLNFATDETPEVALQKFRLDLTNYIGLVPTSVGIDLVGFDTSIDLFKSGGDLADMLRALGYERFHADYRSKLSWKEADSTVNLDDFRFAITDVGVVTGSAVLGGLQRKDLNDVASLREAILDLNLVSSSLSVEDKSIINRWIAQQAYEAGVDQSLIRNELANQVGMMLQGIGKPAFQQKVAAALRTYILRPGKLTATVKPPDPLPVSGIALFAAIFPETLPDILGLDVTAVAGPEPVPFKYVPPADPNTGGGDDLRHVPYKKY